MGHTIAEKILLAHSLEAKEIVRPGDFVRARVDLLLLNDVNGPAAFRHFAQMGGTKLKSPDKVVLVCDHFAPAPTAAAARLLGEMRRFAEEKGIRHYFGPGQGGIEHTLVLEQGLVHPGALVAGGDSHTCTAGALNAFGVGMSWAGMAAIMALDETWFLVPESLRFEIKGRKAAFVTGKDIILDVLAKIGVDGALHMAMEFGGPALSELNMDDRMAICNMAVEAGAKTAIVEPDEITQMSGAEFLKRECQVVRPDKDAEYSACYDISLSQMRPMVAKPSSPGNVVPIDEVKGVRVDQVYMGNCANGTISDLRQIASVLKGRRVARSVRAIIVPATQKMYRQAIAEGLLDIFVEAGAAVSTPTCGACFGGHNGALGEGEVGVATINRNFRGRAGHVGAQMYLCNSYVAAATAVAGELIDPVNL